MLLGSIVGLKEGHGEGILLGLVDGFIDGSREGYGDGTMVGGFVSLIEGSVDGINVGTTVGEVEGLFVVGYLLGSQIVGIAVGF